MTNVSRILVLLMISLMIIPGANAHIMSDSLQVQPTEIIDNIPANLTNISLSLKLDDVTATIRGNITIDYYNDDPVAFSEIPLHIFPSGMDYETRPGDIEILNVTDTGESPNPLDYDVLSESQLMWVTLNESLPQGERTEFRIEFITTLPDGGYDRANSNGTDIEQNLIYTFASAYPIPCVYDERDGWNTDPYLHVGDPFYYDMAYYDVLLEVDANHVVAATGAVIDKLNLGSTMLYHYNPTYPVREFVFSASRHFIVESQMAGGVNVSVFYLPVSQEYWNERGLQYSVQSLILFNESFGHYPYSTLNVVETYGFFGGMEYPCQVIIAHSIVEYLENEWVTLQYLEYVIAHEIGHQWWYQLVGVDEVDQGFVDEGLTVWSHNYYGEAYYGDWTFFQYTEYADSVRSFSSDELRDNRVNQSIYDFSDSSVYYYTAYTKAPLLLQKLRVTIGDEAYFDGLQLFFERYAFKNIFFVDFVDTMSDAAGEDLSWYFAPWFNSRFIPDYSYGTVVYNPYSGVLNITIADNNEGSNGYAYSQAVPLVVYSSSEVMINTTIWINGTTTISLSVPGIPTRVSLRIEDYVIARLVEETNTIDTYAISTASAISTTTSTSSTVTSSTTTSATSPTTSETSSTDDVPVDMLIIGAVGIMVCVVLLVVLYMFRRN